MTIEEQREVTASQVSGLVSKYRNNKPKSKTGPRIKTIRKYIDKISNCKLSELEPDTMTLIALYCWFYIKVYGIDVSNELIGKAGLGAKQAAWSCFEREFNSNFQSLLAFMGWVWAREKTREKWRIENNRQGTRITWRKQFSPSLINEYKLAKRRAKQSVDLALSV